MNYRHAYHAGNFADVFKHIIFIALIQALQQKDKGFCILDTHAGIGRYDLSAHAAKKSQEFVGGIATIWPHTDDAPRLIQDYLHCVKITNHAAPEKLRFYPGSPLIAKQLLRPQDRLILSELHASDAATLRDVLPNYRQVAIHHQDGYQALKAFLPPPERRGLVLIDPPYEKPDEFKTVCQHLSAAIEKWETGVFALWYPIKEQRTVNRLQHDLKLAIQRPLLALELCIHSDITAAGLNGSGMIIVNPPWQLAETIAEILPWLWQVLSPAKMGRTEIFALN